MVEGNWVRLFLRRVLAPRWPPGAPRQKPREAKNSPDLACRHSSTRSHPAERTQLGQPGEGIPGLTMMKLLPPLTGAPTFRASSHLGWLRHCCSCLLLLLLLQMQRPGAYRRLRLTQQCFQLRPAKSENRTPKEDPGRPQGEIEDGRLQEGWAPGRAQLLLAGGLVCPTHGQG